MRGLGGIETAKKVLDGWVTHYNYVRPHMELNGETPAQAAGIDISVENGWNDLLTVTLN